MGEKMRRITVTVAIQYFMEVLIIGINQEKNEVNDPENY